jgi:hypothetical protein
VSKTLVTVILVIVMVALIVGCDVLFLRNHLGLRLAVNVGIVVVFGAITLAFLRHS